jgi:hypothetical protein
MATLLLQHGANVNRQAVGKDGWVLFGALVEALRIPSLLHSQNAYLTVMQPKHVVGLGAVPQAQGDGGFASVARGEFLRVDATRASTARMISISEPPNHLLTVPRLAATRSAPKTLQLPA